MELLLDLGHGLMLLWFADLMNVTETLQFIDPTFRHSCLVPSSFRLPLMKALDKSVERLGLWIVTSSVTFIKSANQSSIKPWPRSIKSSINQ